MPTDRLATRPNNGETAISKHLEQQKKSWVLKQVAILAEAFATPITPERMSLYAEDLKDFGKVALGIAFQRARKECKFFPQIAEILERIPKNSELDRQSELERMDELKRRQAEGEQFYTIDEVFQILRTTVDAFEAAKKMPDAPSVGGNSEPSESLT